jgi:predicted  nucleic acid-binding Zn-ribbon protein
MVFEMETEVLWSGLLTAAIGAIGWYIKSQSDELQRLQILLNRTREEIAKEYVTKVEVHNDINRIVDRLEAMDAKIDRLMERFAKP